MCHHTEYKTNESMDAPFSCLLWMDNFLFSGLSFDTVSHTVYVLNTEGELRRMSYDGEFLVTTDSMEIIKNKDISDILYLPDKGTLVVRNILGLCQYHRESNT